LRTYVRTGKTPEWAAADLILLDPEIEIGVVRGGFVDHPRYAGRRIFGAGINLTRLYRGQIDFLFYLMRDLGFLNKVYRGLMVDDDPARAVEKLWIAAVEIYAIGGACQLLPVVDPGRVPRSEGKAVRVLDRRPA